MLDSYWLALKANGEIVATTKNDRRAGPWVTHTANAQQALDMFKQSI
jgi:hypothetical protein